MFRMAIHSPGTREKGNKKLSTRFIKLNKLNWIREGMYTRIQLFRTLERKLVSIISFKRCFILPIKDYFVQIHTHYTACLVYALLITNVKVIAAAGKSFLRINLEASIGIRSILIFSFHLVRVTGTLNLHNRCNL